MTFYFYDLETSGLDPRWHRIMQFAGQRTDQNFKPIGDPDNFLVRLTPEILPDPRAVLVTAITPQQTLQEGITELELVRFLDKEVFTKDTTALGFNSIRFDDEFMRYTLYRNFYDPYEREWSDGRSRWDIIDLVRMMRALRPEGLQWPQKEDGMPTNRLEELTKANNIEHDAHDALADVQATIAIAKKIKKAQPQLFDHLFKLKNKKEAEKLLDSKKPQPVVHSTGKYSSEHLKTSVVWPLATHPTNQNAILVFDLRRSPLEFFDKSAEELAYLAFTPWQELASKDLNRLPVKAIHLNRSPAIAPLGVLDKASQERISLSLEQIRAHQQEIAKAPEFASLVAEAFAKRDPLTNEDADAALYDGFISDSDKHRLIRIQQLDISKIAQQTPEFTDKRLLQLWPRFKARNDLAMSDDESTQWEQWRAKRLIDGQRGLSIDQYQKQLEELYSQADDQQKFLLEELSLWAESIIPFENETLFDDA